MGSFCAEGFPPTEVGGPCEGGLKTARAMRLKVGMVLFMSAEFIVEEFRSCLRPFSDFGGAVTSELG